MIQYQIYLVKFADVLLSRLPVYVFYTQRISKFP